MREGLAIETRDSVLRQVEDQERIVWMTDKDFTIVVGMGEVGRALYTVLGLVYDVASIDVGDSLDHLQTWPGVMHVCFPYSNDFISQVQCYQEKYRPWVTVIHSTVPMGTSLLCGAVHSPIIGVHPNLRKSLLAFTKFVGGQPAKAGIAARHMQRAGIKTYITGKAKTTEAMKILSTQFYALMIEFTKEVKDVCDEEDLPFEMWTLWTNAYNEGYKALGKPEVMRPNLVPMQGKLGGHCLLQNLELLGGDFRDLIKKRNST